MRRSQQINAQLQDAIALAQANQRTEARRLLLDVVAVDPEREIAWMWLATLATEREERLEYLERALMLNPHNAHTQEAYARLTGQAFTPTEPDEPTEQGGGLLASLQRESSLSLGAWFVLMVLGAVALVIVLIAINGRKGTAPVPTVTVAPVFVLPTHTPGPTPTSTGTPMPTWTPGPSPTSLWDAPLPTWTPSYTHTPAPTRTPWPTATDTFTPTASPSATPTVPQTATEPPISPTASASATP